MRTLLACALAALASNYVYQYLGGSWGSWLLVALMAVASVGVVYAVSHRTMVTVIERPSVYQNTAPFGPRTFPTTYRQIFDVHDLRFFDLTELADLVDDTIKLPAHVEPAVKSFVQDRENVHSSYIQTGLSKTYNETLRTPGVDPKTAWQALSGFFGAAPELDSLLEDHPTQKMEMYSGDSVLDILYNVYNSGTAAVRTALRGVLPTLDDDMCATGKASRIIETAFIERPEDTPVTKMMVQASLLHKASALKADAAARGLGPDETKKTIVSSLTDEYAPRYGAKKVNEIIAEWGSDIY